MYTIVLDCFKICYKTCCKIQKAIRQIVQSTVTSSILMLNMTFMFLIVWNVQSDEWFLTKLHHISQYFAKQEYDCALY